MWVFFKNFAKILQTFSLYFKNVWYTFLKGTLRYFICGLYGVFRQLLTLQAPPHKMIKHTQTIRRLLSTNCLSGFDHFVKLALKRLIVLCSPRSAQTNRFFIFSKFNYCMGSSKITFFEGQTFSGIEYYDHLKIALLFSVQVFQWFCLHQYRIWYPFLKIGATFEVFLEKYLDRKEAKIFAIKF